MGLLGTLWSIFMAFLRIFQRITIKDPENHVILVTGCDTGFGYLTTLRLLSLGYSVVALCLNETGVSNLQAGIKERGLNSQRVLILICDVTKDEDIDKVQTRVSEHLSKNPSLKMWALVNNAGVAWTGFTDWLSMDAFKKTMDVNYFGIVRMVKCCLPFLKKVKFSRIINISSMAGHLGFAHGAAYCGSKHAVEGFAKCLRLELLSWNIYVCNINPGYMKTPILDSGEKLKLLEWNKAPQNIRDQYPEAVLQPARALNEENPELVVDCIVDQLTRAAPEFNNYPGVLANQLRWMLWLLPRFALQTLEDADIHNAPGGYAPHPHVLKAMQSEK